MGSLLKVNGFPGCVCSWERAYIPEVAAAAIGLGMGTGMVCSGTQKSSLSNRDGWG